MNIVSLLEQIERGEIVLPAIQRDFVWSEAKVERLMDSIMRGYPIGIVFLWETYSEIGYREFVRDYRSDSQRVFYEDKGERFPKRRKLVLDGQQRLQSLYIALYGTYEGRDLYFDVLSGRESEDFNEDKFLFSFLTPEEADRKNKKWVSQAEKEVNHRETRYFCNVKKLLSMGAWERQKLLQEINEKLNLSDEDELRLGVNLSTLHDVLFFDRNIVQTTVIDEYKPRDSRDRKSESEILEIFVRINRQGTPLSRSDLFFSMLKLNWKDSTQTLDEFVGSINEGNSFELDSDFVVRSLLAVSDFGARFDVNLLRNQSNINVIKDNYPRCCNAIREALEFVQDECWVSNSKLLNGYNNLIPFVYHRFHVSDDQISGGEINRLRKAVYLFGFSSLFSRYSDQRLGKFIREVLKPAVEKNVKNFPLDESLRWVWDWEKLDGYGTELVQRNPLLALYLAQHGSGDKQQYKNGIPKTGHIFPRSELRKLGYDEADVNHFANLWILPKDKRSDESNKNPKEYFEDVKDSELKKAFIDRSQLDYRHYKTFLKEREAKILAQVKKKLKLSDSDLDVSKHWKIDHT